MKLLHGWLSLALFGLTVLSSAQTAVPALCSVWHIDGNFSSSRGYLGKHIVPGQLLDDGIRISDRDGHINLFRLLDDRMPSCFDDWDRSRADNARVYSRWPYLDYRKCRIPFDRSSVTFSHLGSLDGYNTDYCSCYKQHRSLHVYGRRINRRTTTVITWGLTTTSSLTSLPGRASSTTSTSWPLPPWPTSLPPPQLPTPQASSTSSAPSPSPTLFTKFAVPELAFTLDNVTYTAPSEGDPLLEIILLNGTIASIEYPFITIKGTQLRVPEVEGFTPFCKDLLGWEVCFAHRLSSFIAAGGDGDGGDHDKCGGGGCAPLDIVCLLKKTAEAVGCLANGAAGVIEGIGGVTGTLLADAAADFAEGAGIAIEGVGELALDGERALAQVQAALAPLERAFESIEMRCLQFNEAVAAGASVPSASAELATSINALRASRMRTVINVLQNLKSIFIAIARNVARETMLVLRALLRARCGILIGTGAAVLANDPNLIGHGLDYLVELFVKFGTDHVPLSPNIGQIIDYVTSQKPGEQQRLYFIQTDLDPKIFNIIFIHLIHDGSGDKTAADMDRASSGPCYFARLNKYMAYFATWFPKVVYVHRQRNAEEEIALIRHLGGDGNIVLADARAGSRNQGHTGTQSNTKLDNPIWYDNDWGHRKLLSSQRNVLPENQESKWDESLGEGSTVFVIDTGFDVAGNLDEYRVRDKDPDDYSYFLPNEYTLPDTDPALWFPADIRDDGCLDTPEGYLGHGTQVASLAAGTVFGVASRAELYLIKPYGAWESRNDEGAAFRALGHLEPGAWRKALQRVEEVVLARGLQGKAVVSLTVCLPIKAPLGYTTDNEWQDWHREHQHMVDAFTRFQTFCKENGVTIVMAAGNLGWPLANGDPYPEKRHFTGDLVPQRFAEPDNELISVGATHFSGSMVAWQSQPGVTVDYQHDPEYVDIGIQPPDPCPAQVLSRYQDGHCFGVVDMYAAGSRVPSPPIGGWHPDIPYSERDGTSFAAPQVAGLAAYFLMNPSERERWQWNPIKNQEKTWGLRMKEYMKALSYQRIPDDQKVSDLDIYLNPIGEPVPYRIPDVINVAYNGAFGPQNGMLPDSTSKVRGYHESRRFLLREWCHVNGIVGRHIWSLDDVHSSPFDAHNPNRQVYYHHPIGNHLGPIFHIGDYHLLDTGHPYDLYCQLQEQSHNFLDFQSSVAVIPVGSVNCPVRNGTIITTQDEVSWEVQCGVDREEPYQPLQIGSTATYEMCAEFCSKNPECLSFSWVPITPVPNTNCWLHSTFFRTVRNDTVWGGMRNARPLNPDHVVSLEYLSAKMLPDAQWNIFFQPGSQLNPCKVEAMQATTPTTYKSTPDCPSFDLDFNPWGYRNCSFSCYGTNPQPVPPASNTAVGGLKCDPVNIPCYRDTVNTETECAGLLYRPFFTCKPDPSQL
ncbi:hypothetical protein QBC34DRAFT_424560 [Podospora aff. communis PSN243]|uniref:Peptidase S8/S53 domain-containing protein n=1 Tax=Podospora aff. communis PSN243 TaxID=3040156 RepID=A0AAV9GPP9_9PEZI|nr:hypothetical protein QBC34DRAFT_424560 [Podospora aff. communis PSN243]